MGAVEVRHLTSPAPLSPEHDLSDFRCSEPTLERWLKERARRNEAAGASRTFVVCSKHAVVGYYCLNAGAVAHEASPGSIKRNMPDPIPVVVLGRLAVHSDWTGRGLGKGLLKDAVLRSIGVAGKLGVRALLCHAISDKAKDFYLAHGFILSPVDPQIVMLKLSDFSDKP